MDTETIDNSIMIVNLHIYSTYHLLLSSFSGCFWIRTTQSQLNLQQISAKQ